MIVVAALLSLTDLRSGTAAAASHAVLVVEHGALRHPVEETAHAVCGVLLLVHRIHLRHDRVEPRAEPVGRRLGFAGDPARPACPALRPHPPARRARQKPFLPPLVISAYVIAALAILPPVFLYNGVTLAYAARQLDRALGVGRTSRPPRTARLPAAASTREKPRLLDGLVQNGSIYHWFASLPLPVWVWIVDRNNEWRAEVLPILLVALAWFMVLLSHRLGRSGRGTGFRGG
ncbi:MAG: hypothetical protein M0C28_34180 [Candidatus Moduliflexus flocculans]|nr:hypothetical protein [Candidatus Moduliflexus flocculans]